MKLSGQIRKYRDTLGLSQEELAEKIFVTRQSVSNWENGKTYPDLQSLLRLSELFSLSLDELIKGDIETMKEEINKVEIEKLNRWSWALTVLLLAMVLLPVPLLKLLGMAGALLVIVPLYILGIAVALKVERIKKENDIHTYKEILAFSEGKTLDELEKAKESGKRPYQQVLLGVAAGGITLAVLLLLDWLLKP